MEQHLPLARHLARRYSRGQDRDDIEQVASLGLVRAVDADQLLARLSPRDAEVLRLRFRHDLVQREIAAKLGMSQMQVSRICARAIARLGEEASAT